ncbi:hypothetical protein GCM10009776_30780 [Microbacterium deminutum]|uniref:Uncharacterized protein n=1 Tax=Microbacterium deminutum TaxID=344164 RepID=A0ABN2R9S6_9MICO
MRKRPERAGFEDAILAVAQLGASRGIHRLHVLGRLFFHDPKIAMQRNLCKYFFAINLLQTFFCINLPSH